MGAWTSAAAGGASAPRAAAGAAGRATAAASSARAMAARAGAGMAGDCKRDVPAQGRIQGSWRCASRRRRRYSSWSARSRRIGRERGLDLGQGSRRVAQPGGHPGRGEVLPGPDARAGVLGQEGLAADVEEGRGEPAVTQCITPRKLPRGRSKARRSAGDPSSAAAAPTRSSMAGTRAACWGRGATRAAPRFGARRSRARSRISGNPSSRLAPSSSYGPAAARRSRSSKAAAAAASVGRGLGGGGAADRAAKASSADRCCGIGGRELYREPRRHVPARRVLRRHVAHHLGRHPDGAPLGRDEHLQRREQRGRGAFLAEEDAAAGDLGGAEQARPLAPRPAYLDDGLGRGGERPGGVRGAIGAVALRLRARGSAAVAPAVAARARRRASENEAMSGKRSSGRLASARRMASSSAAEMVGSISRGGRGHIADLGEQDLRSRPAPENGTRPVASS